MSQSDDRFSDRPGDAARRRGGRFGRDEDENAPRRQPKSGGGSTVIILIVVGVVSVGCIGVGGILVALMIPAVSKVRNAAERMHASNNMKQIALAFHNYHDANGMLPPAAFNPKERGSGLSWRVHLLPHLEGETLFKQFRLDEPWDSPANQALIPQMPMVFLHKDDPPGTTTTRFRVFVGGGAMFDPEKRLNFTSVTDGLANTILAIEGDDPVVWTKPDEYNYSPAGPLPSLGKLRKGTVIVVFGDGSVKTIDVKSVGDTTLRGGITRAGGEMVGF